MTGISELIEAALLPAPSTPCAPTGFQRLDDVTGGLRSGRIWIVTGTPGQGRSVLLTQWAGALAVKQGWRARLVAPREDARMCGARLLASLARVPMQHTLRGRLSDSDLDRIENYRQRLGDAPLQVRCNSAHGGIDDPWWLGSSGDDSPSAVIIDDVHLLPEAREFFAIWAKRGALVVVSLPRHCLLQGRRREADLDPLWAAVADVIVEVRHNGLKQYAPGWNRVGEADLSMLKHRHGPLLDCHLLFQGHFARFLDGPTHER